MIVCHEISVDSELFLKLTSVSYMTMDEAGIRKKC
jgi:hypothetical protein